MSDDYEDLTDILDRLAWWRDETTRHIPTTDGHIVDGFPLDEIVDAGWTISALRNEVKETKSELRRLRCAINDAIDLDADVGAGSPLSPVYGGMQSYVPNEIVDDISEHLKELLEHLGWRFTAVNVSKTFDGTSVVSWRGKPPKGWDGETMPY